VKRFPEHSKPYVLLGDLYVAANETENALTNYQKAKTLKPAIPILPVKLVRTFLKGNLLKQAQDELTELDKVVRENPQNRES